MTGVKTYKPGVLEVLDEIHFLSTSQLTEADRAELKEARATVEKMAGALAAVRMLRQLGGMTYGSREVVLIACDAADEALAEFRGTP